jgi:hypothetical protein
MLSSVCAHTDMLCFRELCMASCARRRGRGVTSGGVRKRNVHMLAWLFPGTTAAPSICASCWTSVLKPVMA